MDLWRTPDQHGATLMHAGKPEAAVRAFKDKNWRGVAMYRSGSYDLAYKQFIENKTSDGQYNAGNAAAFAGNYQDAITAYEKAIALNSNNTDAVTNRDIVKKLLEQKKQQDQKNKSANNKNDKKDSAQNNSDKNSDQQKQQDAQKNPSGDSKQQSAENEKQTEKSQQQSGDQKQNAKTTTADSKQQRQDENGKQLLRRITDDPGGLLQQKFLRDYARRHDGQDDQGVN
jgi:Ca-activated chloride channel family protein